MDRSKFFEGTLYALPVERFLDESSTPIEKPLGIRTTVRLDAYRSSHAENSAPELTAYSEFCGPPGPENFTTAYGEFCGPPGAKKNTVDADVYGLPRPKNHRAQVELRRLAERETTKTSENDIPGPGLSFYKNAKEVTRWANNILQEDVFTRLDKNQDGYVNAAEIAGDDMERTIQTRKDLSVLASHEKELAIAPELSINFDRWWNSNSGVSREDLKEVARRAKDLPRQMDLASRVEPVFMKHFDSIRGGNTGLRRARMESVVNSPWLTSEEKQVFKYIRDNWRDFKHDIGNQLNRDEAIMPGEIHKNAEVHMRRLSAEFEIVNKLGQKLRGTSIP